MSQSWMTSNGDVLSITPDGWLLNGAKISAQLGSDLRDLLNDRPAEMVLADHYTRSIVDLRAAEDHMPAMDVASADAIEYLLKSAAIHAALASCSRMTVLLAHEKMRDDKRDGEADQ